ncbi:MAG: MFS transporter [Lachnospiraceae bacterium]|nr:MFS transporter [Lachnospiraceae bacterium]
MSGNFKKFLLLWGGELISSIGGGLTSFGLGVYIFNTTGSAAGMAMVTLFGFLPTLVLGIPAGVLADRYDRRLLMMIGDGCSALGVIYILIAMTRDAATLPVICTGVLISAIFSALLEPSYKATITDLLTEEEYSKAGGLVSLAGSARYLISPLIAGLLLTVAHISLLLIIDICTFLLTVVCVFVVRNTIPAKEPDAKEPFLSSMAQGWKIITGNRGVLILVMVSSLITLFMGMFQILAEPFILSLFDAATLGVAETICACGMLVTALYLGIRGIDRGYHKRLAASLCLAGIFIFCFALSQNIILICFFGFLFFACLPVANNCLDFLIRTNIPSDVQGRAWGLIGFLSQTGYVIAYSVSGIAADSVGNIQKRGVGYGAATVIMSSGLLLFFVSLTMFGMKSIKGLEAPKPCP